MMKHNTSSECGLIPHTHAQELIAESLIWLKKKSRFNLKRNFPQTTPNYPQISPDPDWLAKVRELVCTDWPLQQPSLLPAVATKQ